MPPTDITRLELPAWAVPTSSRASAVAGQNIEIRTTWWQSAVRERGLPGEPPSAATLTRAEVWCHRDDVFTLLWHALAWGAGRYLRQNLRRMNAIADDVEGSRALLTKAAEVATPRTRP